MGFFKELLPHKATPTELSEVHARLDAEMCGFTQEWALESLGAEKLLPLIYIADNEKLGATTAILYAYRLGYLAGKENCDDSREMDCRRKILCIINQIDSLEHLRKVYTTAKVCLRSLTEDEKGTGKEMHQ